MSLRSQKSVFRKIQELAVQKKPLVSMSAIEIKPGGFGATTGSDSLALLVAMRFVP